MEKASGSQLFLFILSLLCKYFEECCKLDEAQLEAARTRPTPSSETRSLGQQRVFGCWWHRLRGKHTGEGTRPLPGGGHEVL